MKAFLFLMKLERISNIYLEFYINLIIFEFLVDFVIDGGEETRAIFKKIIGMDTHVLSLMPLDVPPL